MQKPENIVSLCYDVSIGKVDNLEVDFIAIKADDKIYVQVTEAMTSEEKNRI